MDLIGVREDIRAALGRVRVGLEPEEIERLGGAGEILKCAAGDLGWAIARGVDGAATVSATVFAAASVGIDVVATGGIGGVHRGDTGDVSADLPTLAHHPVAVVAAGAKSILDLPRTLETLGVPVVGLGTRDFPAFLRSQQRARPGQACGADRGHRPVLSHSLASA